jgi:hypothetical protein
VETVWGVMTGSLVRGRSGSIPNRWSGEAERSIALSGGYGELGTVEQVEPWWMKAGWPWLGRTLPYVRQSRQDKVRRYKTPAVPFLVVLPVF